MRSSRWRSSTAAERTGVPARSSRPPPVVVCFPAARLRQGWVPLRWQGADERSTTFPVPSLAGLCQRRAKTDRCWAQHHCQFSRSVDRLGPCGSPGKLLSLIPAPPRRARPPPGPLEHSVLGRPGEMVGATPSAEIRANVRHGPHHRGTAKDTEEQEATDERTTADHEHSSGRIADVHGVQ